MSAREIAFLAGIREGFEPMEPGEGLVAAEVVGKLLFGSASPLFSFCSVAAPF